MKIFMCVTCILSSLSKTNASPSFLTLMSEDRLEASNFENDTIENHTFQTLESSVDPFDDQNFDYQSNSHRVTYCRTPSNQLGVCSFLYQCNGIVDAIVRGRYPNICSWQSNWPMVCCPTAFFYKPPNPPVLVVYPPEEGHGPFPHPVHTDVRNICGRRFKTYTVPLPLQLSTLEVDATTTPSSDYGNESLLEALILLRKHHNASRVGSEAAILENQDPTEFPAQSEPQIPSFIVGGIESSPNSHPWIASLGVRDRTGVVRFICGASLITEQLLLTAAHCIIRSKLVIRMGHHNLKSDVVDQKNVIELDVKRAIVHPDYRSPVQYNDIALLQLERPVKFSRSVSPICLPFRKTDLNYFEKVFVTAAGWGATSFHGPTSDKLQEVTIETVDLKSCEKSYSRAVGFYQVFPEGFTDKILCAGVSEGGKDSCQGDSGGPLEFKATPQSPVVLAGIVSTGLGCGQPRTPGVYTSVSKYMNFINQYADYTITQ